jgi:hypothetical protein
VICLLNKTSFFQIKKIKKLPYASINSFSNNILLLDSSHNCTGDVFGPVEAVGNLLGGEPGSESTVFIILAQIKKYFTSLHGVIDDTILYGITYHLGI